jgi:hypothetical protein
MNLNDMKQHRAWLENLREVVSQCTDPKFKRILEERDRFIEAVKGYPVRSSFAHLDAMARAGINLGDYALYIKTMRHPELSERDIIRTIVTDIVKGLRSQHGREETADILEQVMYGQGWDAIE